MRNFTLRQKLVFSQIILVIFFVAASFPIVERTVRNMVFRSLDINTQDLIDDLLTSKDEAQMIKQLSKPQPLTFNHISLYNASGDLLYDTRLSKQTDLENFVPYYPPTKEALLKALREGKEFSIEPSGNRQGESVFFINTFQFHGKTYILRTAITYHHIAYLRKDFTTWFITFSVSTWLFFSILTWLILHRLHRPIEQIISAIKLYQMGDQPEMPEIIIGEELLDDVDLKRLAETLNSLSSRIREQLQTLKLERNEKERILDSLEEGVFSVVTEGIIRYVNTTAAKMLSAEKQQMKGKHFEEVVSQFPSPLMTTCGKIIKECQKEMKSVRESLVVMTPRKVFLDVIGVPKPENNGVIIVIQDTSNHHRILEIGKDFIANASHELRTPITIIRGFAETLHDMPDLPKATFIDITEKIVRNCQRMDALIKNLLLLADIEYMPTAKLQECDLIALIEGCIEITKTVYKDAQISIHHQEEEIFAKIDPDLLELAFLNLLHNAAKYSNPPANITISLEKKEKKVAISICDKGIGIAPQELDHIFERFYTVNKAHSRKLGGAGLGLSIVKTIIEKHEGKIVVESELGKGSTFTVYLPLSPLFQK